MPELLAEFIGVLLGFLLTCQSELEALMDRVPEIRRIVNRELERIRNASRTNLSYIRTDAWTVLVNVGEAGFLPLELQEKLFDVHAIAKELDVRHQRERETLKILDS